MSYHETMNLFIVTNYYTTNISIIYTVRKVSMGQKNRPTDVHHIL